MPRRQKELAKERPVLKDMDFRDAGLKIAVGADGKKTLDIIKRDAEYLSTQKLMDYSLLVGIHDIPTVSATQ